MADATTLLRVLAVGITAPGFSRSALFRRLLAERGFDVRVAYSKRAGLGKFLEIWRASRTAEPFDAVLVGYGSHLAVPFARLLARRRPIVFDLMSTLYEGEVLSRRPEHRGTWRAWKWKIIDYVACRLSDIVLVETDAQARFVSALYGVPGRKLRRVFTGADELAFRPRPAPPAEPFTVVFRGRFLPEAGARHAVAAAAILAPHGIRVRVYGQGLLEREILEQARVANLPNLEVDTTIYGGEQLGDLMGACHASLGQLEAHERLERTIPHKAFESACLGVPYISARAAGIEEMFVDGESAILVPPADPAAIADAALRLRDDLAFRERIAAGGRAAFLGKASETKLAAELEEIFRAAL